MPLDFLVTISDEDSGNWSFFIAYKVKLAEKHDTGQEGIKIIKFEKRNSYYLYIYDPETRKVSTPSLNSENLDWCQRNWFQTYASFQKKGGSPKQRKKVAITTKLKAYVEHQWQRTKRGEIKESTYKTYNERITNRIAPFIKAKGVNSVSDINRQSFQDYATYHSNKGISTSTLNSDITTLENFLAWLTDEDDSLDANRKPRDIKRQRQVKDFRAEANPAFTGEDWVAFKDALLRYEYLDESWTDDMEERERWWYRKAFVNFIFFQWHSGSRNHETLRLRYGDVKYEEYTLPNGKTTLRGIIKIGRDTKRGSRTSVINGWQIKRTLDHFHQFNHPVWLQVSTNDDTPLFLNPRTGNSIHQETFRGHFKNVIKAAGLQGKGYTLYSLRSTHITNQLLNKVYIEDIARNLGTSADMIRRHYDGVANILKSDELLKLNKHYYKDND